MFQIAHRDRRKLSESEIEFLRRRLLQISSVVSELERHQAPKPPNESTISSASPMIHETKRFIAGRSKLLATLLMMVLITTMRLSAQSTQNPTEAGTNGA